MRKLRNTPVFNSIVFSLVLVLSTIYPLFFSGVSASAMNVSTHGWSPVRSGSSSYLTYHMDGDSTLYNTPFTSSQDGSALAAQVPSNNHGNWGYLRTVNLSLQYGSMPANSLYSFSLRFVVPNYTESVYYNTFSPNGSAVLLSQNCVEQAYADHSSSSQSLAEVQCNYLMFDPVSSNAIGLQGSGNRFSDVGIKVFAPIFINYVVLENEDGSGSDYNQALNDIQYLQQDQYNRLVDILSNMTTANNNAQAEIAAINNVLAEQQATTRAINAQTQQQHDDYENEVQREEDKQDELEDQADDVNISANAIANPFSNLFGSPNCASLPTLASWLHVSANNIQVCSPYPQQFRPIIEFVSSAIVVGLLIRVYYKQLRGGYDS